MKPSSLETVFELSPMQSGVLFHTLYAPASAVYLNQSVLAVEGEVSPQAMTQAWSLATDRHQVLRCSFFWEGIDRPVQAVHRHVTLPVAVHDWRDLNDADQEAALERFLAADRANPFDLRRPPQMRVSLIRTGSARHLMVWTRHHILFDGWSQALLLKEVFRLYEACKQRPDGAFDEEELVGPRMPFERYIGWLQQHTPAGADAFWRAHLAGVAGPTPLGLAVDRGTHPSRQREIARTLSVELSAALDATSRRSSLTLASIYQAAWALIIADRSRHDDVVFGTTVSGRPAAVPGVEQMVGLFINSLPIRAAVDPLRPFASVARALQEQHVRLIDYQHSPLVDIQRCVRLGPGTALFDTVVVIGNYPTHFSSHGDACSLRVASARSHVENSLPVTLRVMPGDAVRISILYDDTLLDTARAVSMLDQCELLLSLVPGHLDLPVASFLAQSRDAEQGRVHAALAAGAQRLAEIRRHPSRRS